MIDNQWYAVLSSRQVKRGGMVAARRFGEDILFFRDEAGRLGCVSSLCAHRGASLSKGCVKDGRIVCPFHGIAYDMDGRCVLVPSEGRTSAKDFGRFRLRHYALMEIGGVVFAWYGDGEPKGSPDVFEVMINPSFTYDEMEDTWNTHYSRVIENQLDVSHLPFVHSTTIGRGQKTVANGPKVVWKDDNTLQTSANNERDVGQLPKSAEESVIKETNLTFKFPNLWLNHVSDKIQILAYFIPVDDCHSIIALRFYHRLTGAKAVNRVIAWFGSCANKVIERQDKRIVETQVPKMSSLYMKENLVAADLPILEYRRRRKELQGAADAPQKKRGGKQMSNDWNDRKAMYRLSYGLFVLTARDGERHNGCITNTGVQLASNPDRIGFAVNQGNFTHDMVKRTGRCNLSVISQDAGFALFKRFGFQSGRDVDKFEGFTDWAIAENGISYITKGTNACFSIEVDQTVDLGSHTLFIGRPVAMTVLSDSPSATYDYYQANIKEKPERVGTTAAGQTIWRCKVCGYEYVGEELPDDYICPVCKHPASDFERVV